VGKWVVNRVEMGKRVVNRVEMGKWVVNKIFGCFTKATIFRQELSEETNMEAKTVQVASSL
jgi:hypothetical protein